MHIPYGWTSVSGMPTEVASEQAVIQQIRDWRKQGWTQLSIAARLNAQSVKPPRGSDSWNYENIDWLMTRKRSGNVWQGDQTKQRKERVRAKPIIYMDMQGNVVDAPKRKP